MGPRHGGRCGAYAAKASDVIAYDQCAWIVSATYLVEGESGEKRKLKSVWLLKGLKLGAECVISVQRIRDVCTNGSRSLFDSSAFTDGSHG